MSGLHQYTALNEDGGVVHQGSGHGSCTGLWGWSHGRLSKGVVTLEQAFGCVINVNPRVFIQMAQTRILQSLVPGLSYKEGSAVRCPIFIFPNVHTLPSDQVICAMRMIKVFLADYNGGGWSSRLREYEFTMDELLPIYLFASRPEKSSDSTPLLASATKGQLVQYLTENPPHRGDINTIIPNFRKTPHAGAILPLIRGEIREGFQNPLIQGYLKESSLTYVLSYATPVSRDWTNPERGFDLDQAYGRAKKERNNCWIEWWDMVPDDASYSVNHPLIHYTEEAVSGPLISARSDEQTACLNWLAQSLGK